MVERVHRCTGRSRMPHVYMLQDQSDLLTYSGCSWACVEPPKKTPVPLWWSWCWGLISSSLESFWMCLNPYMSTCRLLLPGQHYTRRVSTFVWPWGGQQRQPYLSTVWSLTQDHLHCGQQQPPLAADPRSRQPLLLSSLHPEAAVWGGTRVWRISLYVLVEHKYINRHMYFTVRGEIRQHLMLKCSNYFRQINQ
jgi:hypothetical protein